MIHAVNMACRRWVFTRYLVVELVETRLHVEGAGVGELSKHFHVGNQLSGRVKGRRKKLINLTHLIHQILDLNIFKPPTTTINSFGLYYNMVACVSV